MKLSVAQIDADSDKRRNLALIGRFARRAHGEGATIVAFPEYSMYEKKMVDASFADAAESMDGPFVSGLAALALELGICVVAGVVEANPTGGLPFNTIVAIGADGRTVAAYRKIHLFDSFGFQESASISRSPSLEPVVFEAGGIRIGLMTCYDLRFPELARELADAGAEVVLVCSSWVPGEGKIEQWRVLSQARAIENAYFVGAVSQTVPISIGHSLMVDPAGTILGELGESPDLATFDIDRELVATTRERDPALRLRRYSVHRLE